MAEIQKYQYNGEGYHPFLISKGWQVAKLNYVSGHGTDEITRVELHVKTDEVFILLKGKATLIEAIINGTDVKFVTYTMETGVTYNVPKDVWHNIYMNKDAEIIIVEKDNTHLNDVVYFDLSEVQKHALYSMLRG